MSFVYSISIYFTQVILNISGERSESPLSCTVTIAGTDVIGGLEELVRAGVITSPAPQWVMTGRTVRKSVDSLRLIFLGEGSVESR